ncbi:23S rRNA (uracil(1939)-C(5))-methyltransferase RlmD [Gallibacterium genomosp. 1]|uniref:23S rRNA (uracil(1939)-C(5))-methyltransferase RlmD n=1 Tax=Gallibacterium genomosp. 1 TaxID=155515 RepID=A0A0A2XYT4_9PAST|nr:23S rRNA (uracil(1939)-C(5))-methyltransferase RlmD [Gallibacterium genomosp. 1]KGQ37541.1 23S rRNA methyltransferase [Gallibacterium genomosp. 1]
MVLFYQATTKTSPKNKIALIESLDYQGLGIAKIEGKTWFIADALPGEKVLFTIQEEKRQYGIGKTTKRLTSSAQRLEPLCPYYQQCGGCQMQHIPIEMQRRTKEQALIRQLQKIAPEVKIEAMISGEPWHYRRRTRLSVQYSRSEKQIKLGFRRKQSNQPVEINQCSVLMPELSALLPPLTQLLQQWQQPQKLGHIELVAADNGVALFLRHLGELNANDAKKLQLFGQQHRLMLFVSEQEQQVSAWTEDKPYYQSGTLKLFFDIRDFIQVNRQINDKMVQTALNWLDPQGDDQILDLFCGMGNFTLPLAQQSKRVVGIEGVAQMVEKARYNAQQNKITNALFHQADLSAPFANQNWAQEKFNKILLDPPRSGAAFVLNHLIELQAEKILYVSCNPATLVRDAKILVENGYHLEKSAMIDMFPQTGHLESITLFSI